MVYLVYFHQEVIAVVATEVGYEGLGRILSVIDWDKIERKTIIDDPDFF